MRLLKGILIQLGGILLLLLVWGMLIEPRLLDVEQEAAAIPQLSRNWEGRQISLCWRTGRLVCGWLTPAPCARRRSG
jgi:hypothetical protein